MLVITALITGLGLGSMYGLLALGFHVTYAVSATVNFAQGSSMMLGAVFAYVFAVRLGFPLFVSAFIALMLCAVYGALVELIAVRPFARRGSNAWLMATVALGIVVDNTVLFTFGKEPRGFQMAWAQGGFDLAGLHVSYIQLLIPVVGIFLAGVLNFYTRNTRTGKAMLAVVQNPEAARLMGINVPVAICAAFALSAALAGAAGFLIAPLFNVNADMGTVFGLKAFAVAILGGIGSAWGVMLAGILFGVVEALITTLLGSTYTQILTFTLVIVALALMPNGIFGRAEVKKV
jgi:branched-chain amino acid transport system permease protein